MAAATITACQPQKVNGGEPVAEQARVRGALHDVVRGGEQRRAAEGEDHRVGVQRPQPAVGEPGNAEVERGPQELRGDEHADRHPDHAPDHVMTANWRTTV
jgi:23S rRNA (cytosine1962-C5)-methyltransferase